MRISGFTYFVSVILVSCAQRPWVTSEIDCSWEQVLAEQRAVHVAFSYLEKKGISDVDQDSVRVSIVGDDYWVSFLKKKEFELPGERAVLVTKEGCASFIPLK